MNIPLGRQELQAGLGRNLTHGLVDRLGRAIVTGKYDDAPPLTEAELAQEYGVSRSVIREALKMLAAKGLLGARPRQGTVVEPPSSWNLFDNDVLHWLLERGFSIDLMAQFNQLRAAIEPEGAALAARAATPSGIASIEAGLTRMMRAEQGLEDALEADIAFHVAILQASGNPFYLQLCEVVDTALRTSIRLTNRLEGRPADLADHAEVLDAIRARDIDRSRSAMRALIDDTLKVIERHRARRGD